MSNLPSSLDRSLSSDRNMMDAEARSVPSFAGLWEYTVIAITPLGAALMPTSSNMPPLQNVALTGLVGPTTTATMIGSKVIVAFLNQDPARAFVLSVAITQTMLLDSTMIGGSVPGPVLISLPIVAPITVPT